jgi:translation initiation factor 1A
LPRNTSDSDDENDTRPFRAETEEEPEESETEEFVRVRVPNPRDREMFGIADQLVGGSRIKVNCEDGRARLGRIPGKMKRRMWIRTGDLLIIKPWEFQDDKCDILYRYFRTQAVHLSKKKLIPETIDIF